MGDLYVFLVDDGSSHEFSVEKYVAREVEVLQRGIQEEIGIPVQKQVLIMSDGMQLESSKKLSNYSAGTENNPIFLFSKDSIVCPTPPSASFYSDLSEVEAIKSDVERALALHPTFDAVSERVQLALRMNDLDKYLVRTSRNLVHDQHFQNEGWSAVVKNTDQYILSFTRKAEEVFEEVDDFQSHLDEYEKVLSRLPDTVASLKALQLPASFYNSVTNSTSMNASNSSLASQLSDTYEPTAMSLYDYMTLQNGSFSLEQLGREVRSALANYSRSSVRSLREEVRSALAQSDQPQMKLIGGLDARLRDLDHKLSAAVNMLKDQDHHANGFVANEQRLSSVADRSVLPDLCESHRRMLLAMLKNHLQIVDINNKCRMAKDELAHTLHARLQWIMTVQEAVVEADSHLAIRSQNIHRLSSRLTLMQQADSAPSVAASLLSETYRRRKFSKSFIHWADGVSSFSKEVLEEEVERRKRVINSSENHFLSSLVPSISEMPPSFATESVTFDESLPVVTREDIENVREVLPELSQLWLLESYDNLFSDWRRRDTYQMVESTSDIGFGGRHTPESTPHASRHDSETRSTYTDASVLFQSCTPHRLPVQDLKSHAAKLIEELGVIFRQDSSVASDADMRKSLEDILLTLATNEKSEAKMAEEKARHPSEPWVDVSNPRFASSSTQTAETLDISHHDVTCQTDVIPDIQLPSDGSPASLPPMKLSDSGAQTDLESQPPTSSSHMSVTDEQLQAEKQTAFNRALNAVVAEKNARIMSLESEVKSLGEKLASAAAPRSDSQLSPSHSSVILNQPTSSPQASWSSAAAGSSSPDMTGSVNQSYMASSQQQPVRESENTNRVQEPVPSPVPSKEKVAISDFQTGDLVLICFNDVHNNYILFAPFSAPVMYFLHEKSLAEFQAQFPPGEKRSWMIGVMQSKEYCKAKRPENRFRVAVGQKFFRVKATPWTVGQNR